MTVHTSLITVLNQQVEIKNKKLRLELMGKKGSKKTAKKAYKQSAAYLKKGAKKQKGK
jgi:hypothetical protein